MRIGIASGKGGTGKTTFATSLAVALAQRGDQVTYLDCDVEAPNGHLLLEPTLRQHTPFAIPSPRVDERVCGECATCDGACGTACRRSAIVVLGDAARKVVTYPSLCNGCGGCALACPVGAIREVPRAVGEIAAGHSGSVAFLEGRLKIGEALSPPLIRALIATRHGDRHVIVDAPPGTSCPVIAALKEMDAVLLVAEPTPFGLNDLQLAASMVRDLGKPFGVAINRADIGDDRVAKFCERERIPVLMEVAEDRSIAEAHARGQLAIAALPGLTPLLAALPDQLRDVAVSRQRPSARPKPRITERSTEEANRPSAQVSARRPTKPREVVVVSGKGGTGKTSIVASLFALAQNAVVADCDVDAADLHLVLTPEVVGRWEFSGGFEAEIDADECLSCGMCADTCRFEAIRPVTNCDGITSRFIVDPVLCEGCGVCADNCPVDAAVMVPSHSGEWFVSETRRGPMVHARLVTAGENSGKLVSLVRQEARAIAQAQARDLILVDGPPGVGCPVIASITGADLVLLVTEPTLAAIHDLDRVASLCEHFRVPAAMCINREDLHPDLADRLVELADERNIPLLGRVPYDTAMVKSQLNGRAVVEEGPSRAARGIRDLWSELSRRLREVETRSSISGPHRGDAGQRV